MVTRWSDLLSHQEQRALFLRSLQKHRLSHAYMLSGPEGVGKRQFARLLAKSFFCRQRADDELDCCGECRACRGFEAGTWADFSEIGPPPGKREIPVAMMIGDDNKRGREGLCYELSIVPQNSERRVAIINDAHQLTTESENALLKTLEEPPAAALILLICDTPDSLLPTIRSRCQNVRFFGLPDDAVARILLQADMVETPEEAAVIAALSDGSVAVAAQLLNPELRQLRDFINERLCLLGRMDPIRTSRHIADELDRISANTEEERRNTNWLLRFMADFVHNRLKTLTGGDLSDPLLQQYGLSGSLDLLAPVLDRIVVATRHIEGNSPVRLVLESLFDEIARTLRLKPHYAR